MRIQVDCRHGEPRAFYLGSRRLHVLLVLERAGDALLRNFRVRVTDGRIFVLSHDLAGGGWQLARVQQRPRSVKPAHRLPMENA
jgi:hypothetical protein